MKLNLEIQEVNFILAALGKVPYEQSHGVIHKVQAQAQAELERMKEDEKKAALSDKSESEEDDDNIEE